MRCPKCGKDVELQKKQVGVDESGKPIFNEYAICRDCKKQWNLDKQREKKAANANASNHTQTPEGPTVKKTPAADGTKTAVPKKKPGSIPPAAPDAKAAAGKTAPASKADAPAKKAPASVKSGAPVKKSPAEPKPDAPVKKAPAQGNLAAKKPAADAKAAGKRVPADARAEAGVRKAPADGRPVPPVKRPADANQPGAPVKKAAPAGKKSPAGKPAPGAKSSPSVKPASPVKKSTPDGSTAPVPKMASDGKPPVKKKPVPSDTGSNKPVEAAKEQRYGNIPPEKVRAKREKAVKASYEDMLAADSDRKPVKRKKPASTEETAPKRKPAASAPARKKTAPQPMIEVEQEIEEPKPKFRGFKIILGILSIAAFAFFAYKGFLAGLNNISAGTKATTGTIYIVLALCMLISGLLLLIMQKKRTIFAFLLPMLLYIGGAVFAFLKRGEDKFLLYGAIVGAAMAVIFLILAFASRGGDEEDDFEDDYDDPFEDDYDD